ncbi:MAG: alpha-1,2-fucosyltransferase [Lachnospiraceae bacterium]|nr:alpha-1,2-fucosyltransferase [Lachnospiraceae bacterium]
MIIVRIYEGLGNQLFQYAYARALSLSTDQKVFLDIRETGSLAAEQGKTKRKCELTDFRITLPICQNVQNFYPYLNSGTFIRDTIKKLSLMGLLPYKFYEEPKAEYHKELLTWKGNWYLQGWFQDERYFSEYREIIRKEIVPRKKIRISGRLKEILKTKNTVSVHIRRGDYVKVSNQLPISYYHNAMEHMKSIVKDPFWIIFSDDVEWVKRNLNFTEDHYFVSENEKLEDYEELMVMSRCKNQIIANSTFSWWGAWLNKNECKTVIGPERWFLRGKKRQETYLLSKNWIAEPIK